MLKYFMIFFLICVSFPAQAKAVNLPLSMMIIKNDFQIKPSEIKMAQIEYEDNGNYRGLHMQLKSKAAKELENLTKKNPGSALLIIFNKKILGASVLQAPLTGNFILNIPKEEAEAILRILTAK